MLRKVRMQFRTDGCHLVWRMDHGLLRSRCLTEDIARQQGRRRSRGAGAGELAARDTIAHFVGNVTMAAGLL